MHFHLALRSLTNATEDCPLTIFLVGASRYAGKLCLPIAAPL
jgi:hypothetical protein